MKLLSPTPYRRLNEVTGFVLLSLGLVTVLSLISYHAQDPSWDTASGAHPLNLVGYPGAYFADLLFQVLGASAFLLPLLTFLLSWKWIRSDDLEAPAIKLVGSALLTLGACATLSFLPLRLFGGVIRIGGTLGYAIASYLVDSLNIAGAVVVTGTVVVVSIYLVSTFTIAKLAEWLAHPVAWLQTRADAWHAWRDRVHQRSIEKAQAAARKRFEKNQRRTGQPESAGEGAPPSSADTPPWEETRATVHAPAGYAPEAAAEPEYAEPQEHAEPEIPICPLEEPAPAASLAQAPPAAPQPAPVSTGTQSRPAGTRPLHFELPPTDLLNEPPGRNPYDQQELKETAARIKAKFEEFAVLGNVVQINPGPVVTTFEFKPEAGIKLSRITNLTEDLALGLQAESILIERIPGKSTVGIEVPNTRRELIALRQMLESEDFTGSNSRLTIPLGKDINGRIRVATLESMPHLLIAGSTGAGKSVMINSMIMAILYKATPDDVRLIMVDPKRVELGMYEGIPHLLTPVIIDPKKATNALRNAVLEMERRLRLLAEQGARNIDQYNKKIQKLREQPRNLFADEEATQDELRPLPYILILIDELADLMMLEGKNVEESVTRLAQMARAVGMHLVLATQRPSVDVITGLIKANFPARISFRVATRVDSRTVLDEMGAEHLLGKGDMLFRPPGSSRLTRVHGAFVTETEINRVVDFWKEQAAPEYDQSFLIAPPSDDETAEEEPVSGEQDPMYEEAVRLVLQMGKASTSTLQRHLRLGYGRAARILDMMQRDGIIGPPDGSRPRDVLKRPDWLREVEDQVR
ncbi:MAG TPA: DNA translocase FtsK 4TM domain-containing protein [Bryobacteraceae bacterium]|nr:DNA translocase FtsK 4TM domain-containing protein [Bryobacteraceae bacterium]